MSRGLEHLLDDNTYLHGLFPLRVRSSPNLVFPFFLFKLAK